MSKLQHTPGPWKVRKTVDETGDYPFPTYDILAIHEWGPEGIACAFQNPNNARLIAAAPEMLEALIMVKKYGHSGYVEGSKSDVEFWFKIDRTIEKATGMSIEEILK